MWYWTKLSTLKLKISWAALPTVGRGRHMGEVEENLRAEIPENAEPSYAVNVE